MSVLLGWMWGGRSLSDLGCQMPGWESRELSGVAEGQLNDGMVGGWVDEWEEERV